MTEVMKTPPPSAFSPHLRPSESDRSNHRRSNRQQRSYSRQPSTDHEESDDELREPSEWDYPDQALQRHMELLDEKRTANLERLNNIFELQKENLKKMSEAFEYQAWEDFAFSRLSLRRSMTEHVCEKIVKLQDELDGRPIARASTNPLHLAWNPPERPESISSFVQGLEEYEIDDDIRRAKGQYMLRDWAESSSDDDDS
ncbi:unnamed protein product [Umbelopsis ramanniana]